MSSSGVPDFLSAAAAQSPSTNLNFTPSISEDTLTYTIHLPPSPPSTSEATAQSYITLINSYIDDLLHSGADDAAAGNSTSRPKWLWHKDGWELGLIPEMDIQDRRYLNGVVHPRRKLNDNSDSDERMDVDGTVEAKMPEKESERKLEGHMRIGDAVDDEWLVVWLLKAVSEKWPELVISIRDTDGEFLLIEAANFLPRWVNPDNVENRFWIASGHLHLIPLDYSSNTNSVAYTSHLRQKAFDKDEDVSMDAPDLTDASWLSEADAVRLLRASLRAAGDGRGALWAGEGVEQAVWERVSGYPSKMSTHYQRCLAYLPESVARALRQDPALVQRAVEGFYTKDPIQVRNASRSTHFLPKEETTVLSVVTMTRTAYAQLSGQAFQPPRTFGTSWRVPPPTDMDSSFEKQLLITEKRRRDLGVKITVGFEIMYKEDSRRVKAQGTGKASRLDKVDESIPEYRQYMKTLKSAGFFGEEMEGSQRWSERLETAKVGWSRISSQDPDRISFGDRVDSAITSTQDLPAMDLRAPEDFTEDAENWLEVSPDELDGLLAKSSGLGGQPTLSAAHITDEAQPGADEAKVLGELAAKVNQFVEGQGDLQGAQFDDELSDDDIPMGDSDDESDADTGEMIDMRTATEEQKTSRLAQLVPGIQAEEWGLKNQEPAPTDTATKQVSFSADSESKREAAGSEPKMREPILARDKFDGVEIDLDDESDDGGFDGWSEMQRAKSTTKERGTKAQTAIDPNTVLLAESLKSGREMPVGGLRATTGEEVEDLSDHEDEAVEEPAMDMDAEQEDFLKFAREALGINEAMWTGMLDERRARGAYVPGPSDQSAKADPLVKGKGKEKSQPPVKQRGDHEPVRSSEIVDLPFGSVAPATPFAPTEYSKTRTAQLAPEQRNPNLDSFEKVMEAMEQELERIKTGKSAAGAPAGTSTGGIGEEMGKGKGAESGSGMAAPLAALPTEQDLDNMDDDDLIAMDRELRAALKGAGVDDADLDGSDMDDDDEFKEVFSGLGGDEKAEFKMMKDFLESFKAQGGGAGAVGNLFGRLSQGGPTPGA